MQFFLQLDMKIAETFMAHVHREVLQKYIERAQRMCRVNMVFYEVINWVNEINISIRKTSYTMDDVSQHQLNKVNNKMQG